MDEPFGALDALTREELTIEVMRIWREQPKTIVFVTHSIPEAALLADRVVVLSARPGRIAEIVDVRLPRPRDFDMEAHHEFQASTHRITELHFGCRPSCSSLAPRRLSLTAVGCAAGIYD